MSTSKKKIDIVIISKPLKRKLKKRLYEELALTYDKIVANSLEDGIKGINKANLSKYFGSEETLSGSISQKSLLYLVIRYGLFIQIKVQVNEYFEEECIKKVKALFDE